MERQTEIEAIHHEVFVRNDKTHQRDIPPPGARASFDDQDLIGTALWAANGVKFNALWNGDWSGYPSQSEADLALAAMLALRERERFFALLSQYTGEKHTLEPSYFGNLLELINTLVTHPREAADVPRYLESCSLQKASGWGRMSMVDTKPFMLPVLQHRISVHRPQVTRIPARPGGAADCRRSRCIP